MIEAAIRDHLVADGGVFALVATRGYQLKLPQKATLPAFRIQLVSDPRSYHLRGPNKLCRARIQIDAYGEESAGTDPYASVNQLATAIETALSGKVFTAGSPIECKITGAQQDDRRVGYESEELRQIRVSMDYTVWYRVIS